MKLGCCSKLMDMVRAAYDMATHAIKGVQLGSDPEIKYPDGAGIVKLNVPDAGTLEEIEAYIEVSKATDERLSLDIDRLDTAKQDTLIAGANITISADNVISATGGGGGASGSDFTAQNNDGSIMFFKDGVKQAELTEGANITITADGVISATGGGTGGTPTADEVLLTDGRSVQDGIDSIEDELGDLGTSGTVQSRLEALETADASQDADITNLENRATEFDGRLGSLSQAIGACVDDFTIDKGTAGKIGITMDKIDGMTSQSADIITAGDGVTIENGVISASGEGGSSNSIELLTSEIYFSYHHRWTDTTSGTGHSVVYSASDDIETTDLQGGVGRCKPMLRGASHQTTSTTWYKLQQFHEQLVNAINAVVNISGNFTGTMTLSCGFRTANASSCYVSTGSKTTRMTLTYTNSVMTSYAPSYLTDPAWVSVDPTGVVVMKVALYNVVFDGSFE